MNCIFLFIAGAANCGPDLVVSGSLATEVAKAANAESAVAGLVNGMFVTVNTLFSKTFRGYIFPMCIYCMYKHIYGSAYKRTIFTYLLIIIHIMTS